ncbi:MAG: hypothetical protein IJA85_07745 [Clostridia bacterium]|nr:hypothetical protein [Clostridia bacterium]
MKRKLTALLAALMAVSTLLASCSDAENGGSTETQSPTVTTAAETAAETEEPKILPDLPEIQFGGADFRFYTWDVNDYRVWDDLYSEEEDGEPINDAVFKRNRTIEEKYQVGITEKVDLYTDYVTGVLKSVKAGDDDYEVIISMGHHCAPSLYSVACLNLYDLEYVDFTQPWWDQNAVESFTLGGYMPFTVSDMTILDKGVTGAVFFNKKLAEDYNVGNLYDLVYNNSWTMENMVEKAKIVSEDLNGDSIYDANDRYGILCGDEAVIFLFHGSGARFVSKDSDGLPIASFANERNFTVIKYYLETMIYDEVLRCQTPEADMFKNDKGLFTFGYLKTANGLRDMESDFGILPIPKYDAAQESYGHSVFTHGGNLISVPITSQHLDMVGVILEALSAESKYTVIPAFYQTVLKDKAARDEDSIAMLDIIIGSMVFDVGDYYAIGGLTDPFLRITGSVHSIAPSYPTRTSDVASFYEKYGKLFQKDIDKLIEKIEEMNER